MVEQALLIYTTFPDERTALAIGEALVRDRLAACLNVLPGMRSVYRWQDGVEHGSEVVGLLKTREGLRAAATAALKDLHPYETPVVLYLSPDADPATLAWILGATERGEDPVAV